jgi:type II secretory pathway component GspD/PulD (secretin)
VRRLGLILAGCLLAAASWAQSLEVIELRYRTAAEVIPVLQPLLEPGAALSGQDYRLFVRTSSANLSQLRTALAQVDRQPRQLFVSVRRSTREEIERERASASGTLRSGDDAIAVNETPRAGSGVSVRATGSTARTRDGSVAGGTGRRGRIIGSTAYRDLGSGFIVTPRVNAQRVVLDIAQHDDRLRDGAITTQALTIQVSGRLGEWIQLGGVSESAAADRSAILDRQYATRSEESSIWVRVEAR